MIQLQAFALSYGVAMVLWTAVFALDAHVGWIVLAEPLRGVALVLVARRYA